ncbi:LytTR family DNA-binding domain-containing protein [Fructobacillus sp. M158]|uniref:LytR/AlgR family response regulator transcription factor n=1 Tax=Fructobacillus parabroussonetiae TaxID=2713174 RepID=UPI00200AC83B|nr:LytTR family DNA-binding domain-containing protein [Fructobacillus parabroussonetiae]MCK8617535.1 LytTR family DNA-binding domain-containing protein [Fructobacillus parabroussonetiae]
MPCYILSDNGNARRLLKKVLNQPIFFETPSALLHALGRVKKGQVVLLDSAIRGYESAGLQTAQLIRQQDPDAQLIMMSDNAAMAARCFEGQVGLIDFIIKQDFNARFFDRLLRAISKANSNLRRILNLRPVPIRLPDGRSTRLFDLTRIVYFTTDSGSHHLIIHEVDHQSRIRASMRDLAAYHQNLYRVHSSYVINIAYLHLYQPSKHSLTMVTGHQIPVSRHYAGALRQALRWPTNKQGLAEPINIY